MNRRHIFTFSAMTALGLAFSLGTAIAQTKSLKDQLVGTWTVVSWEQTTKDGAKLQRFGSNPKGVNSFGADGHFFMMFARWNSAVRGLISRVRAISLFEEPITI